MTQAFNTTTSMGRLTLNVLLSFAQFEREVTGERIRDKIAASKRKGMWMGGLPPLGYDVKDRKLVVNAAEAMTVRQSSGATVSSDRCGCSRRNSTPQGSSARSARRRATASHGGGSPLARGALYLMLSNRIYRGEIVHKGDAYPGEHAPIIEQELWESVQAILAGNRVDRERGKARLAKPAGGPRLRC